MPKILINERDNTSPGTPASYANYAVLITGFSGRKPDLVNDAVLADSNGVYEFSSAQAFKDTIGLVAPKKTTQASEYGSVDNYHYGNQMAYELLNLGYSIVYKPISNIREMNDANFWEVFKDKASYDFRFITHGLLESTDLDSNAEYISANNRLTAVKDAAAELSKIKVAAEEIEIEQEANKETEKAEYREAEYQKIMEAFDGFINIKDSSKSRYSSFEAAVIGTDTELAELNSKLAGINSDSISTSIINSINGHIANLAKYVTDSAESGRGDCIALIELDESTYTSINNVESKPERAIISAINEISQIDADNGKYCAMTVPSIYYNMTSDATFNNKKFPGAFHYLACFINSLKLGFAEWYAAAGYTRGVSSYMVDHTSVKLGEIAINALEPRNYDDPQSDYPKFACNVIANFRGSYYLWGNRTAHPLGKKGNLETGDLVASSFLNIRQLCTTIKKQLYVACRRFTFDPNSDTLWVNFVNAIKPTLEAMKADQGIRDYKILKVYTDKKATLKAKIRIIPIEAVEDFDLEVSLEDSFGETAAVVNE